MHIRFTPHNVLFSSLDMKPRPLFSGALAALLLWGVSSVPVSAQSTFKVGVVDMKRVFAEYYKTKEAEKSVNDGKEAAKNNSMSAATNTAI